MSRMVRTEGAIRRMFILMLVAALNRNTAARQRRASSSAAATCASNMVGPSLNRRSRKMECRRLEAHSRARPHGGTTCSAGHTLRV